MENKGHNSITEGEVRITNPKVDDLNRIASALERIAATLEQESSDEVEIKTSVSDGQITLSS